MKDILTNFKTDKIQLIRLVLVIFLLFVAFSTESYGLSQTFFIAAYFITVFEVLYKSFMYISKKDIFNEDMLFLLVALLSLVLGLDKAALIVNLYYYSTYIQKAIIRHRQNMFVLNSEHNIEHVNIVNELGAVSVTTPEHIKKGDIIVVNPGECILTDGIVTDGFSTVNTEAVTHEATPMEISINDKVMAGYINLSSPITYKSKCDIYSTHIEAEKQLASESLSKSSKLYGLVKKYSRLASLALVVITVIMLFFAVFTDFSFESVVTVAVISGMIAVKTGVKYVLSDSVYTGIRSGVLIKNADSLVNLGSVSTAIIEFKNRIGDFTVESAEVYDEYTEGNLKDIASCLYSKSSLPFAEAVCRYTGLTNAASRISGYREIDHSGCFAYIDGHQIVSGTTEFMQKSKIHIPFTVSDNFAGVHFAVDGTYIGNIRFSFNDFYKLTKAITSMRVCGVKHFVIFGLEDEAGAERIRNTLNIDYFSIGDDRTRIINDIMDNVSGKIAIFGWHDWLVSGVESVYLGCGRVDSIYSDADIVVSGKSVLRSSDIISIASLAKKMSYLMFAAFCAFKVIITIAALAGAASVYFAIIAEFVIYALMAFFVSYKFKKL